jgi:hypothetical protein
VKRALLILPFVWISLAPLPARGALPESGSVTGTVINLVTREPLPAANVSLSGTTLGSSTSLDGRFEISNVPVGTYQLRVSLVGFESILVSDIVVATAKHVDVVVKLKEAVVELGVVEARGQYFQKSPDAPVSVQQLSYEEIRRSPGGFEDVVRAISVLPGVAQASPGRNDLVVRGGAPSENLFVVDNIEIPNINHFGTQGASGGPLSFINLDFVRETSFSTGGFGVRYGDRMSSVLTIDLADGREDRLGGKATVSASQFGVNLQGPVGSDGTFIFSARRSYLDLIFKAAGFSFVPEYWDFLGRGTYRLGREDDLTVLLIGAIDDVSFFNDNADLRFKNSTILGTAQRQYTFGTSWRHLMGNGFATVTLGRTFVKYNGIQRDSLLNPLFTNISREGETSLRGDVVMQAGRGMEVSFGVQARLVNFDTELSLPRFVTTFGDTLALSRSRFATDGVKGGVYAQVAQKITAPLNLVLGVRADVFNLIEKKWTVSPRASLTYEFSPLTSASVSAGIYRQDPSYLWLVSNPQNRNLIPARATQYIAGVEHLLDADLRLRVEMFYKAYADYPASVDRRYLVLANTGGGYGGSDENFASYGLDLLTSGGSGSSRGVELLLQKKLSDTPAYGLVSITYGRTRFAALDGVERPGTFDQEFIVNLSGGYRFDERWEASAKFRFASGAPFTPFNPDGTQNVAQYNADRTKASHSLDVRVDRRWNFAAWNLITYIDIQNIYNNKFSGYVRWNAREHRVVTNEDGIGILPSIGVSAEF